MSLNLEEFSVDDLKALDEEKAAEFLESIKAAAAAQKQLDAEKTEKGKLLSKKNELLAEVKKLKPVRAAAIELGIDLQEDGAEARLVDLIRNTKKPLEDLTDSDDDSDPDTASKKPATGKGSKDEFDRALQRLQKQLESVNQQLDTERKEKEEIKKRNLERMKMQKVVSAMAAAGVEEFPEQLYELTKNKFRLESESEDAEVVGGDEYEPVPLDTLLGNLRDSKEYKRFFSGSGRTGSGMLPNETRTAASKNPFRTDHFNQTECTMILSTNKDKAKKLVAEARAAGKLDPTMAKVLDKMRDMN